MTGLHVAQSVHSGQRRQAGGHQLVIYAIAGGPPERIVLAAAGRRAPVLLILEDVHWADAEPAPGASPRARRSRGPDAPGGDVP